MKILCFGDSRKTGFALWLAVVSTIMFMDVSIYKILASLARVPKEYFIDLPQLIDAQTWLLCISISAGLFGWGTVVDKKLEIKKKEMDAVNAAVKPA